MNERAFTKKSPHTPYTPPPSSSFPLLLLRINNSNANRPLSTTHARTLSPRKRLKKEGGRRLLLRLTVPLLSSSPPPNFFGQFFGARDSFLSPFLFCLLSTFFSMFISSARRFSPVKVTWEVRVHGEGSGVSYSPTEVSHSRRYVPSSSSLF